ncbi:ATPase, putative [Babesia ovis]|uniref:ATPase, putative n=1 Tax=Babesia ovis TaxID=5869 RepID=A0A9W5T9Q3_BABOV|nr:ATPase, putative [Babesia ovis]
MMFVKWPFLMLLLLKQAIYTGANYINGWKNAVADTSDITYNLYRQAEPETQEVTHNLYRQAEPKQEIVPVPEQKDVAPTTEDTMGIVNKNEQTVDESVDEKEMEAALKALREETQSGIEAESHTASPLNDTESHDSVHNDEHKAEKNHETDHKKVEHTPWEFGLMDDPHHGEPHHEPTMDETHVHKDGDKVAPASETEVTALIPQTPSDDNNTTSGNEDTIINDTTPIAKRMRTNTIAKIDETIEKLDKRLRAFLEVVSSSAHDLGYYQQLLDNAYRTFCKEINGNIAGIGFNNLPEANNSDEPTVMISAEMSSAIRRSFDTKVEVLELAASEVATQKSKEVGARTIHDALTAGLLLVRNTINSPGLTIHTTSNEMKNMTAIIADMARSLLADIISWTLKEDVLKKKLFDKIVERDEFIKKLPDDSRIEEFTQQIRKLAGDFHTAQNEKAGAIQKQNGFKEYMDDMREDINTIQRLIDSYFATVHNGHAKAIIDEAVNELQKDGKAESELRLRVSEAKVHHEALLKEENMYENLVCPPTYHIMDPHRPLSRDNPCVLETTSPSLRGIKL